MAVSLSQRPRSVSEWFQRRCRPLPWLLGASLLTSPLLSMPVDAAGPIQWSKSSTKPANPTYNAHRLSQPGSEHADSPTGATGKIKLNYMTASWETVLKDLAEKTGSELIADRIPAGRYTRRDVHEYTRTEAVRIINREIEPHGFRLIEKGQYLIVIDTPSQRPHYQPAVIPRPTNEPGMSDPVAAPAPPARSVTPVATRKPAVPTEPAPASPIQLASHEQPEERAAATAAPHPVADTPRKLKADDPVTVVVFRARNQRAADLAKRVYRTFRDRAELVDSGRNGLPAMRVRQSELGPTAPVIFTIAIDEQREELLIDARPAESDGLLTLLRRIDTPTLETDGVQLCSTTRTACLVAEQLPQEIERIRAFQQRGAAPRLAQAAAKPPVDPLFPDEPMPEAKGNVTRGVQTNVPLGGPVGEFLGNVKSEVNVEAIPDLGVIILKGNQKDVEQVERVIKELERLSEVTAPKVEMVHLANVNSEALAELLAKVFESLTKFPGKATQPRQSVAIIPVSKPNAVLIIAPANDLPNIRSLASELDEPVNPEDAFQVFTLQTAIATQMEQMLTEFYNQRPGLGARVTVRSEPRSNSLIVHGKPGDLDEVAALIHKLDRQAQGSISQFRVFRLTNAVAAELSAVINAAIQSVLSPPQNAGANQAFGGQGAGLGTSQVTEEFRSVKGTIIEFLAVDAAGQRKLRSGVLADIRVSPDPRMNALMVTAPEASMTLIEALIKQLDRPSGQVAEIKVFTLANADAELMVQQLQLLFGQPRTGATGQQGGQQGNAAIGIQVAGAEDASSGLIPLRFSVDTRTNSVIAIGAPDALGVVQAIMFRLDESDVRQRKQAVYRLKNSPAANIAQAIQQFITSQRDLTTQDPSLFSTVEQLERNIIVVAEPVTNSLLINVTPRYFQEVMDLIKKLDAAPQQVVIQALLVEVELQDTDEFGVELGFQDSVLFNRSLLDAPTVLTTTSTSPNGVQTSTQKILSQSGAPGFLFGNPITPLGNNLSSQTVKPSYVASQGLSNFSVGRTNSDLGFGGLVLSASSESVSVLLRALAANRQARVLSRPMIRTLDNQLAQVQQGQNVPIVSGVTQTNNVTSPTIQRDDAGVILTVIPRISPDGSVVMELIAEKSQYNLTTGVTIFSDTATGNTVTAPVKDISVARTTVSIPTGQTVVLGGLITERTDEEHRKVPYLGDIPLIGTAFRYDYLQTRRTELLIFLTPRIVYDDATAENIAEVEISKLHFDRRKAEDMHGPLQGVPAGDGLQSFPIPSNGGGLQLQLPPGAVGQPLMTPQGVLDSPATPMPRSTPYATPPQALPKIPSAPPTAGGTGPQAEAAESDAEEPGPFDSQVVPAGAVRLNSDATSKRVVPAAMSAPAPGVARPKVKFGRGPWQSTKQE